MDDSKQIALRGRQWRTVPVGPARLDEVEALMARCADYFRLAIGRDPQREDARGMMEALPPGRTQRDKHFLGIAAPEGHLVGVLDLVSGYRREGEWWIGLLLLSPEERNRHLGAELMTALETCARFRGVDALGLGVVEENTEAARFWERAGFIYTGETVDHEVADHKQRVRIYRKVLAES